MAIKRTQTIHKSSLRARANTGYFWNMLVFEFPSLGKVGREKKLRGRERGREGERE